MAARRDWEGLRRRAERPAWIGGWTDRQLGAWVRARGYRLVRDEREEWAVWDHGRVVGRGRTAAGAVRDAMRRAARG